MVELAKERPKFRPKTIAKPNKIIKFTTVPMVKALAIRSGIEK